MAIHHAQSGEPIDVKPLGPLLADARNVALFKSEQLEVMRLVLRAGQEFPPHKVPGEITIQCIEGVMDVTANGKSHLLGAGQMLFLAGDVPHGVVGVQDASAIVTIALFK